MSPRSRSRRTIAALAAAAITATALAACSDEPTEAVKIGNLPEDLGGPIDLGRPMTRFDTFETWPTARELITDETIKALLPQTEQITATCQPGSSRSAVPT